MNKAEATRLAGAINALRPDWGRNGILTVLADERLRSRAFDDLTPVFVALALDPASQKPTRIYEDGPWWHVIAPRAREHNASARIRHARPTDCAICGHPADRHVVDSLNDHEYAPAAARRGVPAPPNLTLTPAAAGRKDTP